MTKKLSLLLLICFLSALNINAEIYSGSCGDNAKYTLDTETGDIDEFISLSNGFSMSATMDAYLDTPNAEDAKELGEGAKWHLGVVNNMVRFWIDIPSRGIYDLSKREWSLSEVMATMKVINELKAYMIFDKNFIHLQIFEYEKNLWVVHLCSVPTPKEK